MDAANLLSQRASLTPRREALLEAATGRRYTYAELNARANRLANFMRDRLGVAQGDRVALLAHNSVVYLDLLYGLAKIGAIFAPLNWRLSAPELAYIVNDAGPTVLIAGPEFLPTLDALRPQIHVPHLVSVEGAAIAGAWSYEAETAQASDAEPERPPLADDDAACLLYTSGTTGRPKGAVIPHRQVLWNCINTVISWGLREDDVSPVLTPLFHAGGLFAFLTPILYVGGRLVLTRQFDPEESLRLIVTERCTVILGVPTLFQVWMNSPQFASDFRHVRFFISGGAPCPPRLMDAWRQQKGVVFRQGFGLTEAGVNCFSMSDQDSVAKSGSVGKPIFHSQMRLVDPATGRDVPAGEPGELLIRGPHVCLGYWRNPAATAEALRDGWLHTGDMARRDDDGFFYIVGRYKDMLKSGGENIYAAEVEAVFREHPAVADAALLGLPDGKWGEVGLLVVMLKPGQTATPEALLALAQGRLARYKLPKRIVFDTLPYSPYGKVIKAELKQKYAAA
jgi:fatty-acyl-CoA synthase